VYEKQYLNVEHGSFDDIVRAFLLASGTTEAPTTACFGVAGPVEANAVDFTNRNWRIDGAELEKTLGIAKVRLINDFVAAGYGLLTLDEEKECVTLQGAPRVPGAPIACVGAGTGLGECFSTATTADAPYETYPSEGGHSEFIPRNAVEVELLEYLKKKFDQKCRVSVERVVSGPGLASMYEFYSSRFADKAHPQVMKLVEAGGEMKGKVIATHGKRDGASPFCQVCEMVMGTFASAYGSEVGSAALKWIPLGGMYVAGGLGPKNQYLLKGDDSAFMTAFRDKGRLSPLLARVPLHLVLAEDIGQRGAHLVAVKLLQNLPVPTAHTEPAMPSPKPPLTQVGRRATQFGMRLLSGEKDTGKYFVKPIGWPATRSALLLVGDCGGTNTRLQLYSVATGDQQYTHSRAPGKLVYEKQYLNVEHGSFDDIVRAFLLASGTTEAPTTACFGVAGPVEANAVDFTNRNWRIDGAELEKTLGIAKVRLINDFVAAGYGLLTLDEEKECVTLQGAPRVPGAPIACVGAGTGLGECFSTATTADAPYETYPSEGGHSEFIPRNAVEVELLEYLKKKFDQKCRVSVERVVSGPGLASMYEFYSSRFADKAHPQVMKLVEAGGEMKGKVIATHGKRDGASPFCQVCEMVMGTFASAYGSEVGSAALKWIPLGGMYVAGGLGPKNQYLLKGDDSAFMTAFRDKGRLSPLLARVPLHLVLAEDIGQRGAHLVSFRMLEDVSTEFKPIAIVSSKQHDWLTELIGKFCACELVRPPRARDTDMLLVHSS